MLAFVTIAYFVIQGVGYGVHRIAHSPRGGALHRAHRVHHEQLYPPEDFLSDSYRAPPASDSSVVGFLPYVVALVGIGWLVLPARLAAVLTLETALVGWLNDQVHVALHLRGHWMERLPWFARLRALHWQHHRDTRTNFGIFSWAWDHVIGTFLAPRAPIGQIARARSPAMREYLVAVAAPTDEAGRIELHVVFAESGDAAVRVCTDHELGLVARGAVLLEGDVLALWNELGRAAFGFGA